jgi:phage terminase large subunit-like protein
MTEHVRTASDTAAIAERCFFDGEKADRALAWIERTFAITLYQWQREILRLYFGWRRADSSYRFTRIYVWVPKKNGKSWLMSVLLGYKLFELRHARIYSVACNAKQAKLVMDELIKICKKSPPLSRRMIGPKRTLRAFLSPFRRDFTNDLTGSTYEALADNKDANDGIIPDVLVFDEIHRMKNAQVDVVDGSTSNSPSALKIIISTAGSGDKTHRSWEKYDYTKKVLSGEVIDTQLLPIVYECPNAAELKGDAIYDLDVLTACNPVLQEVPEKRDAARREIEEAKEARNYRHWRRFRLNQWLPEDGETYIDAETYDECEVTPAAARIPDGAECFIGIDKSGGAWDFHAITGLFLLDDGRVCERHWTFAAADRLEDMAAADRRDYSLAVEAGELILIPAAAITDEWLFDWMLTTFAPYKVARVAADPFNAGNLLERLTARGWDVVAVRQSNNALLSPVICDYAERLHQGRIIHPKNALYSWQLSCARTFTTAKDTRKLVKVGSSVTGKGGTGHIDSVDALINALAALRARELERAAHGASSGIYVPED